MTVAIIDYGSGNLRSASKAFERQTRALDRPMPVVVTDKAEIVAAAERIVLPGVGAFADCMAGLAALPGMIEALEDTVLGKGRPFLGICVGMQLLAARGLEHGAHKGLGWIAGDVVKLASADPALKIPHMGWNTLQLSESGAHHAVAAGMGDATDVYFVHSYRFVPENPDVVLATADYGGPVAAMVGRDSIIGTQFHPEKSQAAGLRLIAGFLGWRP